MSQPVALTRAISPNLEHCELTHVAPQPLDLARAREQHHRYEETLKRMGCELHRIPGDVAFPDCVFIEDTAVVLAELAVVTRPGVDSRRGETAAVAQALERWRRVVELTAPATLDGGDVICLGRTLYVGRSTRSNRAGSDQLANWAEPLGYAVRDVDLGPCLHLKSAATALSGDTVLINPDWCDPSSFGDARLIPVAPAEPWAANSVCVNGAILMPEAFPATRQRVEEAGYEVFTVPADELAKAEGGVSCCSLVFEA